MHNYYKEIEFMKRDSAIQSLSIFYRIFEKYKNSTGKLKRGGLKAKTMGLIAHDRALNNQAVKGWVM